jgi:competence protein ComEC
MRATVDAVLTEDPRAVRTRHGRALVVVTARAERVDVGSAAIRVRTPVTLFARGPAWAQLLPSTRVRVEGRLAAADPGDDVAALVLLDGRPPVVLAAASRLQAVAGGLRSGLRRASAGLPGGADGLLPGLVIGDTSRLRASDKQDFRSTGMTHLVAVSGTNCTAVLVGVLAVTRACGARRRTSAVLAALALLGFVVVARPSPSVVRAAVMGWVALAAWVSGRQRTAAGTLGAAVLLLLLVDPTLAHSVGFALSVLACTGLLLLAPGWRDALVARGWSPGWAEALAVPAAAQIACTPVIAAIGGGLSLVAVPANLLAAPAVAPATMAGVLAALIAPVSGVLATAMAWVAGLPCLWLLAVAHVGAAVPAATVPWPSGLAGAALSALGVLVAGAFLRRMVRQRGRVFQLPRSHLR